MTSVRFAKDTAAADISTFSHHVPRSRSGPQQHPKSRRNLSDIECIQLCRDAYWEPTIFNLGQSYRKNRMFDEAAACFEKSLSICPGKASSYSALGFTRHLNGGRASSAAASASFMSGHYSDSKMSASASNFTFDSGTDVEMG
jgi:tetratricopeptide (TPR) repeat protein